MSGYQKLCLEGPDDVGVFNQLFELKCEVQEFNSKLHVVRETSHNETLCGIVDRDFDTTELVRKRREKASRCVTLQRYCMESYLLDPRYLYEFAVQKGISHHQEWSSPDAIRQMIVENGQKLCHYAAVNEMFSQITSHVNFLKTVYFDRMPIVEPQEIQQELMARFQDIPFREDLDVFLSKWETRAQELQKICRTLSGVHRWINGKVLLKDILYERMILCLPSYAKQRKPKQLFALELASIAKDNPPRELLRILKKFDINVL